MPNEPLTEKRIAEIANIQIGRDSLNILTDETGKRIARALIAAGFHVAPEPKTPGELFTEHFSKTYMASHEDRWENQLTQQADAFHDQIRNQSIDDCLRILNQYSWPLQPYGFQGAVCGDIEGLKTK